MPNDEETTSIYRRQDYYDADKTLETDGDDELCWAASSSNQLWATKWGRLGNLTDEESVLFKVYQPNFPNAGGNNYPSLQWFLEGKGYQTLTKEIIEETEESSGAVFFSRIPGGFYKDVLRNKNDWATRNLKRMTLLGNHRRLYECAAYLKIGYAVNVNARRFDQYDGSTYGGHAITLWGYRYSNKYPSNDVRHIKSIIVTDSDDYQNRATPYHNCPYLENANGRGLFEISVRWESNRIAAGRRRGAWVLGPEYSGGVVGAVDMVLMDSVIIAGKPEPYDTPEFVEEDETEE